ncbi:C-C chemokine receptor type 4-like [Pleurodeles waltl]|uniref:C-C chemokine receptor type 4-like n=1 Tax=Pleurodeles waltl TaxID=8319 RepID=UPI0037096FA5
MVVPTENSFLPASTFYDYGGTLDYGPLVIMCINENVIRFGEVLIPSFYYLVCALCLVGNGLVLYVLLKHEDWKNITTIFVCNMATSDLVFATSLPFWGVYHSSMWIFGRTACKIVSSTFFIGFYSSIIFLTGIAVDRYLAVVHAVTATRSTRCAVFASVGIWSISVMLTIPEFIFTETKTDKEGGIICEYVGYHGENRYVWEFLLFLQQTVVFFLLPFVIILFCYCSIVKTLAGCRTQRKHRALKMIFSIILAFFLCWAPLNITILLKALQDYGLSAFATCKAQEILDYCLYITRNLAFFHCCLNPILYMCLGTNVRSHLRCPCFRWPVALGSSVRLRILSNSYAHSTKDSSGGNNPLRISTTV